MKDLGWLSYVLSTCFWILTFYQIGDGGSWVGGDAYNLIISGTHAITYAITGLSLNVLGSTAFLLAAINSLGEQNTQVVEPVSKKEGV